MSFFVQSWHLALWFVRVLVVFSKSDGVSTWSAILCLAVARMLNLLAFFLPLKVVLLVGSDGIPRYFQGFVTESSKNDWIVFLATVAVAAYVASVVLESVNRRLVIAGSRKVGLFANQLSFVRNQDQVVAAAYSKFCNAAASGIVASLLLIVGAYFYHSLFVFVIVLLAFEYLLSGAAIQTSDAGAGRLSRYIAENLSSYLSLLSSIGFLSAFAFILVDLMVFDGVNMLIVLLSIIISRQVFTNLTTLVQSFVQLCMDKSRVDALIFRAHRHEPLSAANSYVEFDSVASRRVQIADALQIEPDAVECDWLDVDARYLRAFDVRLSSERGSYPSRICEIAYAPESRYLSENEDVLIAHSPSNSFACPQLVRRYEVGGHIRKLFALNVDCQIDPRTWPDVQIEVSIRQWQARPSAALVEAFVSTRPLMQDRVSDGIAEGVAIAATSPEERRTLERFSAELPELRRTISSIPLCVWNPGVGPRNVFRSEESGLVILGWAQWSLEPIGTGLPIKLPDSSSSIEVVEGFIAGSRELGHVSLDHLLLVSRVSKLEKHLSLGHLKAALRLMPRISHSLEVSNRQRGLAS